MKLNNLSHLLSIQKRTSKFGEVIPQWNDTIPRAGAILVSRFHLEHSDLVCHWVAPFFCLSHAGSLQSSPGAINQSLTRQALNRTPFLLFFTLSAFLLPRLLVKNLLSMVNLFKDLTDHPYHILESLDMGHFQSFRCQNIDDDSGFFFKENHRFKSWTFTPLMRRQSLSYEDSDIYSFLFHVRVLIILLWNFPTIRQDWAL